MGANRDALQRYSLAVISHLLLVLAWYLFVELGHVPKFVMPSPYETLHALLVPNYRWPENIAVTSVEIFGGYVLAVVVGIALALVFSWSRWLEMATMPLLVSLNMIPKVALGPLISEMLGVEKAPITYSEDGRGHHVRIGDAADVGVEDFVALEGHDPVQLTNVFHPSNTTLTVAPANAAHLSTFGIDWGREGQSGFSAPFSWAG